MDVDVVVNIIQQAALMILLLSAPMLLIGLVVGLIVSIFLSMVIFGPWIISTLVNFTRNLFLGMNNFIV